MTTQKELPWALTGQVAYVGTRQRDINQILNINAGQVIGLGDAGRPFFARFRRTAETGLLTNVGWSDYDALQTSLQRRFVNGFQLNVAYTCRARTASAVTTWRTTRRRCRRWNTST